MPILNNLFPAFLRSYFLTVLIAVTFLYSCSTNKPVAPNVILIFTDDQGYGDVGCYGAEGFETPHLDQMALEGLQFTDFLVAANVCTPSRAALLTGCYPARVKTTQVYFPWTQTGLAPEHLTIADLLKEEGYATACIGKWHLGHKDEFLPMNQGFDRYFGVPYSNDMAHDGEVPLADEVLIREGKTRDDYLSFKGDAIRERYSEFAHKVPLMRQGEVIEWPVDQTTLTRRYTEEAVGFIREHAKEHFFVYLAHSMPHIPIFASADFQGSSEQGLYGDVMQEIDWSVGQIRSCLKELDIEKNTLVIFTTDNGPWLIFGDHGGSAGPLRDGKGSTYEGGQRVPCLMSWPGTIPEHAVCDSFASTLDIMPTIAALTGASLIEGRKIDGHDITDMLLGKKGAQSGHGFFLYDNEEAIRVGDWKYRKGPVIGKWGYPSREARKKDTLPKSDVIQLFNLKDDLGEQVNLAEKYPDRVKEMEKELKFRSTEIKQ